MKQTTATPIHQCIACGTHAHESRMQPFGWHANHVVTWVCADCAAPHSIEQSQSPTSDTHAVVPA